MRYSTLLTVIASMLLSVDAFAAAEVNDNNVVQKQERSFIVKYKDGSTVKYAAVFTGSVNINRHESGGPSTFSHPFDDRKCHWTITPTITRQSFVILPDGERAEKKDLATVYSVPFTNQGSDFVLTQLRPENCGDALARFQSDINNGISSVNRTMSTVMGHGMTDLFEAIKKKEGIVSVSGM